MDALPRVALEPLKEAGPEMPAAPVAGSKGRLSATTGAARAMPAPAAAKLTPSAPTAAPPHAGMMDRDFIARNQIVERYLSGKLPIKGATDFERFCRDNPSLLDELGLPERVNAGLRLLEASGKPEPWQEKPKRFWENPFLVGLLGLATLVSWVTLAVVASGASDKSHRITKLEKQVVEQPLAPASSTRTIRLLPSHNGGSESPAVIIDGNGPAQLVDLKIDMSRSTFSAFRVTVDRIDQGRVMVLNNVQKDSNGHVRIALNSSALGPGNYQFTLAGLTWRGETVPDAWMTIGVRR